MTCLDGVSEIFPDFWVLAGNELEHATFLDNKWFRFPFATLAVLSRLALQGCKRDNRVGVKVFKFGVGIQQLLLSTSGVGLGTLDFLNSFRTFFAERELRKLTAKHFLSMQGMTWVELCLPDSELVLHGIELGGIGRRVPEMFKLLLLVLDNKVVLSPRMLNTHLLK